MSGTKEGETMKWDTPNKNALRGSYVESIELALSQRISRRRNSLD